MPPRSSAAVEGYIIFVAGINEEAQEDDIMDKFADFGEIKNLHLNLDRRTGFVKGYAALEYTKLSEAQEAVKEGNGCTFMEQKLTVDFAFTPKPRGK